VGAEKQPRGGFVGLPIAAQQPQLRYRLVRLGDYPQGCGICRFCRSKNLCCNGLMTYLL
jgi:hypothetical protein